MTAYWLAQSVGVIAFLIGITTFFNRDERRFKLQLAVYSATIGVHFNQIFNGLLEDHQIRLILQGRAYGLPIKHAIGLSASRPYGWAFAGV